MLVLVVAHLTSPSNLTNALRIFRRYGRRSSPPLERRLVTPQSYARALGLGDRVAQLLDRNAAMFSGSALRRRPAGRSGDRPACVRTTNRSWCNATAHSNYRSFDGFLRSWPSFSDHLLPLLAQSSQGESSSGTGAPRLHVSALCNNCIQGSCRCLFVRH